MALLKGVRPDLHWGRDLFYRGQGGRVRSCPWTSAGVEAKRKGKERYPVLSKSESTRWVGVLDVRVLPRVQGDQMHPSPFIAANATGVDLFPT